MTYIDADYVRSHYADGDECTDLFSVYSDVIPFAWIDQRCNEDVRLFLHTVIEHDAIPCEGGFDGYVYSLDFQGETDGLGYRMNYETDGPDAMGYASVFNVRVYRNCVWDRKDGDRFVPFEIEYHDDAV